MKHGVEQSCSWTARGIHDVHGVRRWCETLVWDVASLSRNFRSHLITLSASCSAAYCNRSCLFAMGGQAGGVCVWVCTWVCYYDNSKLHASILTKLGL